MHRDLVQLEHDCHSLHGTPHISFNAGPGEIGAGDRLADSGIFLARHCPPLSLVICQRHDDDLVMHEWQLVRLEQVTDAVSQSEVEHSS
jgi:hypothetical protein